MWDYLSSSQNGIEEENPQKDLGIVGTIKNTCEHALEEEKLPIQNDKTVSLEERYQRDENSNSKVTEHITGIDYGAELADHKVKETTSYQKESISVRNIPQRGFNTFLNDPL